MASPGEDNLGIISPDIRTWGSFFLFWMRSFVNGLKIGFLGFFAGGAGRNVKG